ncbi:MAG: 3-hydroxyacyl-CoA dehydrogenase family protein [Nitrospinota bacterium]
MSGMEIRSVGVAGCGTMGAGIAQVVAAAGYPVYVSDVTEEALERALGLIRASLDREVEKGRLTAERREAVLGRIASGTGVEGHADKDLVIEAVFEDMGVKRDLFGRLDGVCGPSALFATNTSALCVTEMAAATSRPDRFVGLHFFNPAPVMKLVEVVRTVQTSEEAFQAAWAFIGSLGKEPIASEDRAGFVVDRLLLPYLMEAVRSLEEGVASVEDIDKGMRLGCGFPMGPFTLMDLIGLDVCYNAATSLFEEFREKAFLPPPLLKRMVQAGRLGRKTGRGFYSYE